MVFGPIFEQLLKFIKNPILIGISSKFLSNIKYMYMYQKKYKNGLCTIVVNSIGYLVEFWIKFIINEKSIDKKLIIMPKFCGKPF